MSIKKYDGCSGGMSKLWRLLFRKAPPWEGCCDIHDQPYASGGSAKARMIADIALLRCVALSGHPYWAIAMFVAVRIGGFHGCQRLGDGDLNARSSSLGGE